ncbi:hypothetical protein GCM10010329_61770 [Streptomyces spiroverticillatus]|uniref:HAD hydrolase-like protein n=1 Tax=Streptomyces finlayi TaxID=67296 RepID=A0A918X682_9ACTN|nr:hypothetical protein [Streptomyces finlayi]GHA30208.1 hypothetical protein GCM10010329_61770 [Streptomyces spiroverticillatus]GHD15017.1 hypothetical protein GCM10010334_74660 [Streptomyces finlayi]
MKTTTARGPARVLLTLATALAAAAVPCVSASAAASTPPDQKPVERTDGRHGCPYAYFDLGETLIHTAEDGSTDFRPGAYAHLRALRERHIKVGLITNVPPSWGATDAERAARLKLEVDATWKGSVPFAWADFGDRIYTPRTEAERKPAPALWQRAKARSGGCAVVHQAETAEEVRAAAAQGFVAYQVGLPHRPGFLPVPVIELLGRVRG